jgi:general secretion pathway protein J
MSSAAPPRSIGRASEAGFTLIEVLAALALASLILVSLNLAMNAVTRGVSKTRDSLGTQSALIAATGIFAQDVARIAKIRKGEKDAEGYLFEGSGRQMIYPLSEREGLDRGGLYVVKLRVRQAQGNTQLIRERAPLSPGEAPDIPAKWADPVVLLEGPYDIAFAYRAQRSGARAWTDGWSGAEAMPEQVRLTITDRGTDRLRIPVLVQSLQVDTEVDCASPAAGCGAAGEKAGSQ